MTFATLTEREVVSQICEPACLDAERITHSHRQVPSPYEGEGQGEVGAADKTSPGPSLARRGTCSRPHHHHDRNIELGQYQKERDDEYESRLDPDGRPASDFARRRQDVHGPQGGHHGEPTL
jgi:hypothetical protein